MRDFIHRFGSSQNGHVHFDVGLDDWVAVDHWTSRKRVVVAVWLRCVAAVEMALHLCHLSVNTTPKHLNSPNLFACTLKSLTQVERGYRVAACP